MAQGTVEGPAFPRPPPRPVAPSPGAGLTNLPASLVNGVPIGALPPTGRRASVTRPPARGSARALQMVGRVTLRDGSRPRPYPIRGPSGGATHRRRRGSVVQVLRRLRQTRGGFCCKVPPDPFGLSREADFRNVIVVCDIYVLPAHRGANLTRRVTSISAPIEPISPPSRTPAPGVANTRDNGGPVLVVEVPGCCPPGVDASTLCRFTAMSAGSVGGEALPSPRTTHPIERAPVGVNGRPQLFPLPVR